MKIKLLSIIALLSLTACNQDQLTETTTAQEVNQNNVFNEKNQSIKRCNFDEVLNHELENNPKFKAKFDENEAYLANYLKSKDQESLINRTTQKTLVVKVVVNNIYTSSPISMRVIERQIERLNEGFRGVLRTNARLPRNANRFNAGDTKIRFELEAVNFRRNQKRFNNVFDLYRRSSGGINPTAIGNYINIYVAELIEAQNGFESVGAATQPGDASSVEEDHIFIDNTGFGVNRGNSRFNEGKTLIHEMGHFLGLFHLPGNAVNSCRFDDAIGDTPNSSSLHFEIPVPGASTTTCGSQDMYWSFLNNADDSVLYMFTTGQSKRMRASLESSRGSRRNFLDKSE